MEIRLGTDLEELVALRPDRTMTTWDPAYFPGGEAFWLFGSDNFNDPVFVIAARLFRAANLNANLEQGQIFYAEPALARDLIDVKFSGLQGNLGHTGNCWVNPSYRGRSIGAIANRAIHKEILQRWDVDWIWGLQEKELAYKGLWQDWGHAHCEGQVIWDHNPYAQRFDMKLVYGSREEISRSL